MSNYQSLLLHNYITPFSVKHYVAPTESDLDREQRVLSLLKERFHHWQSIGVIPNSKIPENGDKTEEPRRTKGYSYWHHLFAPRHLLLNGLFMWYSLEYSKKELQVSLLLGCGRLANFNSRLCRWLSDSAHEQGSDVFNNMALNTFYNYAARSLPRLKAAWKNYLKPSETGSSEIQNLDVREIERNCDFWILDPPYADAINYHELSDFFLTWYKKPLEKLFPEWHQDSRKALAIRGKETGFNQSMVESLENLRQNMPDDGGQVLMFTHQDASVWANLALIVWAAGLKVTGAWTIQTETPASGLKKGTYVQGTVLMVLRKQLSDEVGFLNDIYADIENEVKEQVDFMRGLDESGRNVFSDPDYQLAAYASALKILTQFNEIEGINLQQELNRPQNDKNANPVKDVINQALTVAMDYVVPKGFPEATWRKLTPKERFYLKGLQVEAGNEYRSGVYEEMARGFGIPEYRFMLNARANATRLKTPKELGNQYLQSGEFADSFLREVLYAINRTHRDENAESGRNHLYAELDDYWGKRTMAIEVLNFIYNTTVGPKHWEQEREACNVLSGYLSNDTPK